ncbi:hypothetical protein PtrSN002B_006043 [Pyrenophora tritici-repentis]|uniref:Uncharacterized protein n=2 Tax=Pyrenophora tritici-repentis TaxID=45151 RepID=A0A2W1HYR5_9PLEO|nr:uncharacterized protein PTRG_01269 [Pyrenophora tritici-repentis Pt-1C-BFP]KAA8625913.1 hypothetical protein PtrV1_01593 [Pyrenophora tritici-repentis]EDU40707.1 conserved hypothetical protein [Pyrenophora tritici-repentis Pt-1C-BFP]KAF7454326.1 hypothetical protein A1F99_015840 [Pyrenophora tritici-repentis]KAF7577433.1 hypothetical protein PtrM4_016730 [Pyrenophora tritici-repentis]KAG9388073.1 hypothetical protein A1F94_000965 [Pyrenophora tritici-repentis]
MSQAPVFSQTILGSSTIISADANTLLLLLSFLSPNDPVPLDLLSRGATPRKRWTAYGEIEEFSAEKSGLSPELSSLLSDDSRICDAIAELKRRSVVTESEQMYTADEEVASQLRASLSVESRTFWKYQALIATYRAFPWKYLESLTPNTPLFLTRLTHTFRTLSNNFLTLTPPTITDLAQTLLEASRFLNIHWKHFAIY